jgi:dTDP-4-amino-4,6-dideoxygalactose transaminase
MTRMRGDMEWPINQADILKAIQGLFDADTWWIYKGESVRRFEARFAQMHDCNGTSGATSRPK